MRSSLSLGLQLLLAGPLVSAFRWYNWQFDLTCEATTHFVPDDEADLADFVKSHTSSMIKVVGNGHAFGNMTTCVDVHATNRTSHVVSLTNLKDLQFNDDNSVTFGAGWDLVDLIPEMRENGLSVFNIGSERVQNFIGAAVTGTHGTGGDLGNIASSIIGFRVMDSAGEITVVNETHNADLLPAFRISLGALGLITEVTLQAQPVKYFKRTTELIPTSTNYTETFQRIYDFYQEHPHLTIFGPDLVWNESIANYTLSPTVTAMYWEDTDVTDVSNCTDYCANGCGDCAYANHCYAELAEAISTPPGGVCNRVFYTEIEHFIPIEHLVEAGAGYVNLELSPEYEGFNNEDIPHTVRFVKGDDTWMSPVNKYNLDNSTSGVFAVLEVDWYPTYNDFDSLWYYQAWAQNFIPRFGKEYNVRPHWGKTQGEFNSTYAEFIYPHLDDFVALQEKQDPNCQFVNEFLIDHLGLERCRGVFNNDLVPSISSLRKL